MARKLLVAVVATVLVAMAGVPTTADAARTTGGAIDLSSLPAIEAYLTSIGIDPAKAVIQQGLRNYAGADCPGEGWNCTNATVVVQIAPASPAASNTAANLFNCTPASTGTNSGTNTCVIVQTSTAGNNDAICRERNSGTPTTQTCTITQTSTTGNNRASVDQAIAQHGGSAQSATQHATITQTSTGGKNSALVDQTIMQETNENASPVSQSQEAHQDATVTQTATTGDNSSAVRQTLSQHAQAVSKADITQEQNAASAGKNTSADINQSSTSGGKNDSDLRQRNTQNAEAKDQPGPITQTQGSFGGGIHGSVSQTTSSTGTSRSVARQDEDQKLHAVTTGTLTQTQHGPLDCCSTQIGGTGDTVNINQNSTQRAGGTIQTEDVTGTCGTPGNCMVSQIVTQNGTPTTNSCTGTACFIGITCSGEGCFTFTDGE